VEFSALIIVFFFFARRTLVFPTPLFKRKRRQSSTPEKPPKTPHFWGGFWWLVLGGGGGGFFFWGGGGFGFSHPWNHGTVISRPPHVLDFSIDDEKKFPDSYFWSIARSAYSPFNYRVEPWSPIHKIRRAPFFPRVDEERAPLFLTANPFFPLR